MMNSIYETYNNVCSSVSQSVNDAVNGVHNVIDGVNTRVTSVYQDTMNAANNAYESTVNGITSTCSNVKASVISAFNQTTKATIDFLNNNSREILFLGLTATTIAYSPILSALTIGTAVVLRIEIPRMIKEIAMKTFNLIPNPEQSLANRRVVTSFDLGLAAVAAADALILSSFFISTFAIINFLPIIGGVAAGNAIAKWVLNEGERSQMDSDSIEPDQTETEKVEEPVIEADKEIVDVKIEEEQPTVRFRPEPIKVPSPIQADVQYYQQRPSPSAPLLVI